MPRQKEKIDEIICILRRESRKWATPVVTLIAYTKSPFRVLISTLLSLRTKDETTAKASERLFAIADTPEKMVKLSIQTIEQAIFPVGFYHTKAQNIHDISKQLIEKYSSRVPDDLDELLKFKGVGRKTANLVLTQGYGKYGICVDTHVHRISNRFGYVKTKTPEETEFKLREILPKKYWIEYNDLLVAFGQNVCHPTSPKCSICSVTNYCPKIGVTRSR